MTTKIKLTSILQPSPIKQYKDQLYFPNLALKNPPSKIDEKQQKAHDHLA